MQAQLEKIRENQKAIWNKFSSGWEKWNDFTMKFLQPMGNAIIGLLQIRETDRVLDIATGTGEPGLTIAGIAKKGKVIATDLSDDMLGVAAKIAKTRGLPNFETRMADACELPFPDAFFDAISCRMGFMFFPDMQLAANEMVRVLKPGGKMAASVWGTADKNPWIAKMMAVLAKHVEMPTPVPNAPGMFRCSKPGLMEEILKTAGFKNIREKELRGSVDFESPERYWQNMTDIAAPVVNAMANSDENTRKKIQQDALAIFKDSGGKAELDFSALIFFGEKS